MGKLHFRLNIAVRSNLITSRTPWTNPEVYKFYTGEISIEASYMKSAEAAWAAACWISEGRLVANWQRAWETKDAQDTRHTRNTRDFRTTFKNEVKEEYLLHIFDDFMKFWYCFPCYINFMIINLRHVQQIFSEVRINLEVVFRLFLWQASVLGSTNCLVTLRRWWLPALSSRSVFSLCSLPVAVRDAGDVRPHAFMFSCQVIVSRPPRPRVGCPCNGWSMKDKLSTKRETFGKESEEARKSA